MSLSPATTRTDDPGALRAEVAELRHLVAGQSSEIVALRAELATIRQTVADADRIDARRRQRIARIPSSLSLAEVADLLGGRTSAAARDWIKRHNRAVTRGTRRNPVVSTGRGYVSIASFQAALEEYSTL